MTKSFTAATVLLLRDEGRLELDDPAAVHVPELHGRRPLHRRRAGRSRSDVSCRCPRASRATIRGAIVSRTSTPTASPRSSKAARRSRSCPGRRSSTRTSATRSWDASSRTSRARSTATSFERDVLEPLGMTSTGYEAAEFPSDRLATGYVRRDDTFVAEPFAGYGAFASMGGLFSTVHDLARWVDGFAARLHGRATIEHPLSRASRLEMQQVHRLIDPELTWTSIAQLADGVRGRVRVRDVRPIGSGARDGRRTQRRIPGVRLAHAMASGVGRGRGGAGEPHVLPGDQDRRAAAACARPCRGRPHPWSRCRPPHSSAHGTRSSVCSQRGTTMSPRPRSR